MESYPDSALFVLDGVQDSELGSRKCKARHALLKSMALDKNYIDTTTFDALQPAIDYYLSQGNADERLRTLYYKGRIHRHSGDDDNAMQSYMQALEIEGPITDSLTLARLLVAQGSLFYSQYRLNEFIENNIQAGNLYGYMGKTKYQLRSYAKALDGASRLQNKRRADSIVCICRSILNDLPNADQQVMQALLEYAITFGNVDDINEMLHKMQNESPDFIGISFARAYARVGHPETALSYLEKKNIASNNLLDSLTYWLVKTDILEMLDEDNEALKSHRNYTRLLEDYHLKLFSNELLFSEKKHEMEIDNMAKIRKKEDIITVILIIVAVLISLMALIYYRYRLNKAARLLAESKAELLQMEGDNQRLRAEKLDSERTRLQLEAENLHHKIEEMEGEKEKLKELLGRQETLSEKARELIRERISMLNGLIAQALTEQESYGKEFKSYIIKIKKDKKGFQQSLVKVLEMTHPEFISYLREHGLTERELNYCCLYAIGMRGKEIGTYLDLVRHYNISTEVRRKLGLDSNGENLGPFIRRKMMTEE
ncbi:MAG: hypothetical protein K2M16_08190 [Muribaculaceae bacterium]|nr:hypothetical protein [Muribaculaceae bacterium]